MSKESKFSALLRQTREANKNTESDNTVTSTPKLRQKKRFSELLAEARAQKSSSEETSDTISGEGTTWDVLGTVEGIPGLRTDYTSDSPGTPTPKQEEDNGALDPFRMTPVRNAIRDFDPQAKAREISRTIHLDGDVPQYPFLTTPSGKINPITGKPYSGQYPVDLPPIPGSGGDRMSYEDDMARRNAQDDFIRRMRDEGLAKMALSLDPVFEGREEVSLEEIKDRIVPLLDNMGQQTPDPRYLIDTAASDGTLRSAPGYSFSNEEFANEMARRYYEYRNHPRLLQSDPEYRERFIREVTGVSPERYKQLTVDRLNRQLDALEKEWQSRKDSGQALDKYGAAGIGYQKARSSGNQQLRDLRDKINALDKNGFWSGMKESFDLVDLLTLGISGIASSADQVRTLSHYNELLNSGKTPEQALEALPAGERVTLRAAEMEQEVEDMFGLLYGGRSGWNSVGQTLGIMPGFMAGMAVTGGVSGLAKEAIGKATSSIARAAVKKTLTQNVKSGLVAATKSIGGAAARIPFMSMPYQNYMERTKAQYQLGADGSLAYAPTGTFNRAWKATADAFVEVFSEDFGPAISSGVSRLGRLAGVNKFTDPITKRLKLPPSLDRVRKDLRISGPIGEIGSEALGDLVRPLLTGETETWDEMATGGYWWTLAMSMGIMSGAFWGASVPSSLRYGRKEGRRIDRMKEHNDATLRKISSEDLRNMLSDAMSEDAIDRRAIELGNFDWSKFSLADKGYAVDYVFGRTRTEFMQSEAEETERLREFTPIIQGAVDGVYRGQNGNHVTTQLVTLTTPEGENLQIIAGDYKDSRSIFYVMGQDGKVKPMSHVQGEKIQEMSLSEFLSEQYALTFSSSIETERLEAMASALISAKAAGVHIDVQDGMIQKRGYASFAPGDSVTLASGSPATIEENLGGGMYLVRLPDGTVTSQFILNILQPDANVAAAQMDATEESASAEQPVEAAGSTPDNSEPTEQPESIQFGDYLTLKDGRRGRAVRANEDGTVILARDEVGNYFDVPVADIATWSKTPASSEAGESAEAVEQDAAPEEGTTVQPQEGAQQAASEAMRSGREIPTTKDGAIDYNAITDPELYAEVLAGKVGREQARSKIEKIVAGREVAIQKMIEKADAELDMTQSMIQSEQIARYQAQTEVMRNALLFLQDQESAEAEPTEAPLQNPQENATFAKPNNATDGVSAPDMQNMAENDRERDIRAEDAGRQRPDSRGISEDGDTAAGRVDSGRQTGQGISGRESGEVVFRSGRGDIRVFEEGIETAQREHLSDSERARREAESERLVNLAKENGLYIPESDYDRFGERYGIRTGESVVYKNTADGRHYKVKDPYAKAPLKGNAPEDAIYEHLVHNLLFPEVPYRFEGIGSNYLGDVRIILSQPSIQSAGQPTKVQIDAAMAARGLYPEDKYTYGNEWVSVTDVEGDNVLEDENGGLHFIDPIIKFKRPARQILEQYDGSESVPEAQSSSESKPEPASEESKQIIDKVNRKSAARKASQTRVSKAAQQVEALFPEINGDTKVYDWDVYALGYIASGGRFVWSGDGVGRGIKEELFGDNRFGGRSLEHERRSYIGLLGSRENGGATVEEVASDIYSRLNGYEKEYDDSEIRDAVINALQAANSPKKALELLKEIAERQSGEEVIDAEDAEMKRQYEEQRQQQKESDDFWMAFDFDTREKYDERQNIIDQEYAEREKDVSLQSQEPIKEEVDATITGKVQTSGRRVDAGREERGNTLDGGDNGRGMGRVAHSGIFQDGGLSSVENGPVHHAGGEKENLRGESPLGTSQTPQEELGEVSGREESREGTAVERAAEAYDREIAEAESALEAKRRKLDAAKRQIGAAYNAEQTDLFGQNARQREEARTGGSLFDVPADVSQENADDILDPIRSEIAALEEQVDALVSGRDAHLQKVQDAERAQKNLFDLPDTAPQAATQQFAGYEIDQHYHKKAKKDIHVVRLVGRIPREAFVALRQDAKRYGGYYSSYGKGGFVFADSSAAQRFAEERIAGQIPVEVSTPQGEMTAEAAQKTETPTIDYGSHPLTAAEIDGSLAENELKDLAKSYLEGNTFFVAQAAYQNIYDHVRNTTDDLGGNRPTENPTLQVDDTADDGGRGDGGQSRIESAQLGQGGDDAADAGANRPGGGRNGRRGRRKDNLGGAAVSDGAGSDSDVREKESPVAGISAADRGLGGRSDAGAAGNNAGRDGDVGRGGVYSGPDGFRNREAGRDAAAAIDDLEQLFKEFRQARKSSLSLSIIGLNSEEIEIIGRMIVAGVRLGHAYLREGITRFNDWRNAIRGVIAEPMREATGFTDGQVDEFIQELWDSPFTYNGRTMPLSKWAAEYGNEKARQIVRTSFAEKQAAQQAAESIPVEFGNSENIARTLPVLLPAQHADVAKAETQFFDESHADEAHAYGKGFLFTNGTGTGKTYTGLGIIKRFVKSGRVRVLIVVPSDQKCVDWIKDGRNVQVEVKQLDSTKDKGDGVVVTTYANFRQNDSLLEDTFDLVVYDESHKLMEGKNAELTEAARVHQMITNKDADRAMSRLLRVDPEYRRLQEEYQQAIHAEAEAREASRPKEEIARLDLAGQQKAAQSRAYREKFEQEHAADAEAAARQTKVVFLSATPFNTRENTDYVAGYIFNYPKDENGYPDRQQFMLSTFGAGYRVRYNRLESLVRNAQALTRQEIEFSDYLQNNLQTMSGRVLDSEYDYSRDFVLSTMQMADRFNSAVTDITRDEKLRPLYQYAAKDTLFNYQYSNALFETMKVAAIAPRIQEHLNAGRKVVIFHRRKDSKVSLEPPFSTILKEAQKKLKNPAVFASEKDAVDLKSAISEFRKRYADLIRYEQTLNYAMPRDQIRELFPDRAVFFSGTESKAARRKNVDLFNDDTSGKDIIVVQEDSGKEGISLHDRTGEHPRVLISLALPNSPITALQTEGRIFRVGNQSNAIFEYPLLGLDLERILFGKNFNQRVGTTENLALGSQARDLQNSFAQGVLNARADVPLEGQGLGGKELDRRENSGTSFDDAITDYYGNQKQKSGRNNRAGDDYYPTPEPVGFKMVEWADMDEDDSVLEPSAGHGAIARYVPMANQLTAIEPSGTLFGRLQLTAGGGLNRKYEQDVFENYHIVNKHDVVLMNPPYGHAGATAMEHLKKAFGHLSEGGRVLAIIPRGAMDKKLDKWLEETPEAVMRGEVLLPSATFTQAGTSVITRVVAIDRISREVTREGVTGYVYEDLSDAKDVSDLFERLRDIEMPDRIIDEVAIKTKRVKPFASEFAELKGKRYSLEVKDDVVRVKDGYYTMFISPLAEIDYGTYKNAVRQLNWINESLSRSNNVSLEREQAARELIVEMIGKTAGLSEEQQRVAREEVEQEAAAKTAFYALLRTGTEVTGIPVTFRRMYGSTGLDVYADSKYIGSAEWSDKKGRPEWRDIRRNAYDTLESLVESSNKPDNGIRMRLDTEERPTTTLEQQKNNPENLLSNQENVLNSNEQLQETLDALASQFGVPVEVIVDPADIPARLRKLKGYYDPKGDKVVILAPNNTDAADLQATFLHEAVGHFGLRRLLGDKFRPFLDSVWNRLTPEEQKRLSGKYQTSQGDIAVEEMLSEMAQGDVTPCFRDRVFGAIRRFFREVLGVPLQLSEKDMLYMLYRSKHNLLNASTSTAKAKVLADARKMLEELDVRYARKTYEIDFKTGEVVESKPKTAKERFVNKIYSWRAPFKGSGAWAVRVFQDRMVDVKKLQDYLMKQGVEITDENDYYNAENRFSSKTRVQIERYDQAFVEPMIDTMSRICDQTGFDYDILSTYLLAESSLERDNSGIQALSVKDSDPWNFWNVNQIIKDVRAKVVNDRIDLFQKTESENGTQHLIDNLLTEQERDMLPEELLEELKQKGFRNLPMSGQYALGEAILDSMWKQINALNRQSLQYLVESGLKTQEEVARMLSHNWQHYVPLFDTDVTVESLRDPKDIFKFLDNNGIRHTVIKFYQAEGRTSKATDPIRAMVHLGHRIIMAAEDNKTKQSMFRLLNDATKELGDEAVKDIWRVDKTYFYRAGDSIDGTVWEETTDIPAPEDLDKARKIRAEINSVKSKISAVSDEIRRAENIWDGRRMTAGDIAKARMQLRNEMNELEKMEAVYNDLVNHLAQTPSNRDAIVALQNQISEISLNIQRAQRAVDAGARMTQGRLRVQEEGPTLAELQEQYDELVRRLKSLEAEEQFRIMPGDFSFADEPPLTESELNQRVFEVFVNGTKVSVYFRDPAVARAIRGERSSQMVEWANKFIQGSAVSKITRWRAKSVTSLSPDFIYRNAVRDGFHATIMHALDAQNGQFKGFIKNYFLHFGRTLSTIYRGMHGDGQPLTLAEIGPLDILRRDDRVKLINEYGKKRVYDTLYEYFVVEGGQTGFAHIQKIDKLESDLRKSMARKSQFGNHYLKKTKSMWSATGEYLQNLTGCTEDMARFATFLANLDAGKSVFEAVTQAKDITTNFNRRGEAAQALGAIYMFYNPAVQGTAQIVKVGIRNPKRLAVFAVGYTAIGFFNRWLWDLWTKDDDDDLFNEKVPPYSFKDQLIIPLFSKKRYLKIPQPQGLRTFFTWGEILAEWQNGDLSASQAAGRMLGIAAEETVVGYQDDRELLRAFVPSLFQPIYDVRANKDSWGRPIHPEDRWGKYLPDSEMGKSNVNELAYWLCRTANRLAGGNEARGAGQIEGDYIKQAFDVNPSNLEYLVTEYAGGLGKLTRQLWSMAQPLWNENAEFEVRNIPIVNTIVSTAYTPNPAPKYYDAKTNLDKYKKIYEREIEAGYISADDPGYVRVLRQKAVFDPFEKEIRKLAKIKNSQTEGSAEYDAAVDRMDLLMRVSNKVQSGVIWTNDDWEAQSDEIIEKYIPGHIFQETEESEE
jgi:hypothetical protein